MMFYEEKFINGILCFRRTKDSEWKELKTDHAKIINMLMALNTDQRSEVFSHFEKEKKQALKYLLVFLEPMIKASQKEGEDPVSFHKNHIREIAKQVKILKG